MTEGYIVKARGEPPRRGKICEASIKSRSDNKKKTPAQEGWEKTKGKTKGKHGAAEQKKKRVRQDCEMVIKRTKKKSWGEKYKNTRCWWKGQGKSLRFIQNVEDLTKRGGK